MKKIGKGSVKSVNLLPAIHEGVGVAYILAKSLGSMPNCSRKHFEK